MSASLRVRAFVTAIVMGMTFGVTATAPAAEPDPALKAQPGLPTKPTRPITLASPSKGTSWASRIGLMVVAAGCAVAFFRRRRARSAAPRDSARLEVLARAALGHRAELLVVEAAGTRVLVGVTAASMQTLAVLADDPTEPEAFESPAPPPPNTRTETLTPRDQDEVAPRAVAAALHDRGRAFFEALRGQPNADAVSPTRAEEAPMKATEPPTPAARPRKRARPSSRSEPIVEGQARGLVAQRSADR